MTSELLYRSAADSVAHGFSPALHQQNGIEELLVRLTSAPLFGRGAAAVLLFRMCRLQTIAKSLLSTADDEFDKFENDRLVDHYQESRHRVVEPVWRLVVHADVDFCVVVSWFSDVALGCSFGQRANIESICSRSRLRYG